MTAMSARSRRPSRSGTSISSPSLTAFRLIGMKSRSFRASSPERTGVLPFLTTCFGRRTDAAGLWGTTWPVTSQSKSMRMAARCRFTEGASRAVVAVCERNRCPAVLTLMTVRFRVARSASCYT